MLDEDMLDDCDSDDYGYDSGSDPDTSDIDVDCHQQLITKKSYTVMQEADIRKRQEDEILDVFSTLSISENAASQLLYHYNWNVSQLHDEWFADEERVRAKVGLLSSEVPLHHTEELTITCGICFDCFSPDDKQIYPTDCGHPYCVNCWRTYIAIAIKERGLGCLSLRCPESTCRAAIVGRDMICELASEEEKEKYARFFTRSYIEQKKNIKWCPAPGCENAVEFEIGSNVQDVTCLCTHAFCWNCAEDAHRPVDCKTVGKWMLKYNSEAENTEWIIANSKPCPKCKCSIEKNQGCMHMTCPPPCKFEFCWLCLGAWATHSEKTGGFFACNIYAVAKQEGSYDEEENIRLMAKNSVEKYTHYYERWASNHKSRLQAMEDLKEMQEVKLSKLSFTFKETITQLNFIIEAWEQIIECRRVLKWSYAYGYYLPEHENAKKTFFEYLQGDAEAHLERLHHCAERELSVYYLLTGEPTQEDPIPYGRLLTAEQVRKEEEEKAIKKQEADQDRKKKVEEFPQFRQKLTDLTKVTCNFFGNLVRGLENGLSEVDG